MYNMLLFVKKKNHIHLCVSTSRPSKETKWVTGLGSFPPKVCSLGRVCMGAGVPFMAVLGP